MTSSPWIAALLALFLWWFFTGAILWAVKRADRAGGDAHIWSGLFGLPMLGLGAALFLAALQDISVTGAYLGFLSALLVWGWIELAFLSGLVTGPNRRECPPGVPLWERFVRAWGTVAFHEMTIGAALVLMAVAAADAANTFGFWTFAILFLARVSAKLNLFLGVPRVHTEFLSAPLSHMPSHFRTAPMNALFPVSVTALTFATSCWIERAISAPLPGQTVGFALLAAITALATLEHWFMVLPIPDEKLWRWVIPAPKTNDRLLREDPHGL
ncbi:MAG: putative photosynthetic complex assembly protein PuhE [Pseudomonadota bacterium]